MSMHGFDFNGKKHVNRKEYYGKYRAKVTKVDDPLQQGRIKFSCPRVLGDYESPWALPCLPHGYYTLPPVGSLVWVEFEEGNSDLPIWTGAWYPQQSYPLNGKDKKDSIIIESTKGNITQQTPKGSINLNP
jgi:hypothetical protein